MCIAWPVMSPRVLYSPPAVNILMINLLSDLSQGKRYSYTTQNKQIINAKRNGGRSVLGTRQCLPILMRNFRVAICNTSYDRATDINKAHLLVVRMHVIIHLPVTLSTFIVAQMCTHMRKARSVLFTLDRLWLQLILFLLHFSRSVARAAIRNACLVVNIIEHHQFKHLN